MENKMTLLPVKSDFVFKLIFGDQRNVDILADFLKSVLDIPEEEYDYLTIVDPYLKKASEDDKYGILDVRVNTKSGQVIHAEIMVNTRDEGTLHLLPSQADNRTNVLGERLFGNQTGCFDNYY